MADDPRLRTKEWLDLYLSSANILKTDGVTPCQIHASYGNNRNYLRQILSGNIDNDVEFTIQDAETTAHVGFNKKAYAYKEKVTVEPYAINKTAVNGLDVVWQAQNELRRISEVYPLGSVRTFEGFAPNTKDMGGWELYSKRCVLKYKRAADTAQTTSYITYGNGFTDDCTLGTLANWTETDVGNKCALTCSQDDLFVLTGDSGLASAYYSYPNEGGATNLSLSSTVYTKIRVRWATSNSSIKARVELVFGDASTQTIINDESSTTLTVTEATVTAAKTIDHVRLYAKTAAGIVYYDFVQIYKGNFVFPNIVSVPRCSFQGRRATIDIPGMGGDASQGLGTHSKQLTLVCDLDVDNATFDWMRPQANLSKTDTANGQVFHEIVQDSWLTPWVWVNIEGYGAFKALLDIEDESSVGAEHTITLNVTEKRQGSANSEYEVQRFGRA